MIAKNIIFNTSKTENEDYIMQITAEKHQRESANKKSA